MACFRLTQPKNVPVSPIEPQREFCVSPKMDPFVASELVEGLNNTNFQPTMLNKDIVMVMFYKTDDQQSLWSRKHFKKASQVTNRPGHAYGAVDCDRNEELCLIQGVPSLPYYKLYSRGKDVGFSSDPMKLVYTDMKTWVENFPVAQRKE